MTSAIPSSPATGPGSHHRRRRRRAQEFGQALFHTSASGQPMDHTVQKCVAADINTTALHTDSVREDTSHHNVNSRYGHHHEMP
jgi:hypothetical protein